MTRYLSPWTYTQAHPLERLREKMDRMFQDFVVGFPRAGGSGFFSAPAYPALNLWEDETNLHAECELPGIRMEDLDLSVAGNELRLSGHWKDEKAEGAVVHREERASGAFSRGVTLPVDVDADKVSAELRNGVLTITLPKAKAARPRKIDVKCVAR